MSESLFNRVAFDQAARDSAIETWNRVGELYSYIVTKYPQSRERSLAVTKLQEVVMWLDALETVMFKARINL